MLCVGVTRGRAWWGCGVTGAVWPCFADISGLTHTAVPRRLSTERTPSMSESVCAPGDEVSLHGQVRAKHRGLPVTTSRDTPGAGRRRGTETSALDLSFSIHDSHEHLCNSHVLFLLLSVMMSETAHYEMCVAGFEASVDV